jgi:hypothetical protein
MRCVFETTEFVLHRPWIFSRSGTEGHNTSGCRTTTVKKTTVWLLFHKKHGVDSKPMGAVPADLMASPGVLLCVEEFSTAPWLAREAGTSYG